MVSVDREQEMVAMLIVDENCYQKLDMAPTFVSMAATTIKKN
jgi:hypothetical protein